ncbi:hypothetical protein ACWEQ4_01005 [Rhodococcus sp. NPDC003994]
MTTRHPRTYFTSDLHLGHEKVAQHRGFDRPLDHDRHIVDGIRGTLEHGDRLWILGDISSGTKRAEHVALDLLDELTKDYDLHLVLGNHDTAHPMHIGSHVRVQKFLEVFTTVQERVRVKFTPAAPMAEGVRAPVAWLSHFPYFGDGDRGTTEDRHPGVRLRDEGHYLIHGHLHTTQTWTATRSLHVGLDAWNLRPVCRDVIADLIDTREKELTA